MTTTYLKPHVASVLTAHGLAVGLGALSALLSMLVGPCIQLLTAPAETSFALSQLLQPDLARWASRAFGVQTLAASDLLNLIPILLIPVAAAKALFSLVQTYLWELTGEKISRTLRSDLMQGFMQLDPQIRRAHESADAALAPALTNDIRLFREYVVHFYGGLPREGLQVLFLGFTLALLSPKLTVIFFLAVAPAGAFAAKYGKQIRKRASRALQDFSELTEWLQQRLLGIETIKHYKTEAIEAEKLHSLNGALLDKFLRANRVKARTSPMLEALAVVAMVIVLFIALGDVQKGVTTGAVIFSFFTTLVLFSQAIAKLGRYLNSNREGAAAIGRLNEFTDFTKAHARHRVPVPTHASAHQSHSQLVCEGLSAIYPGKKQSALEDFHYRFEGGKIYCIAGRSGAGKSTLFNLILGLVSPTTGKIKLTVPPGAAAQAIGYMPQKVQLAPDTLEANIAYPDAQYDPAKVRAAAAKVGLLALIDQLPKGLKTVVGSGSPGLSGGQTQRIQLARLAYHQTPFVLVDEGTSALDPEVEQVVFSSLKDLAKAGAGVIMIAHRLSATQIADEVLLLAEGKLVASGPAKEVLASPVFSEFIGSGLPSGPQVL